MHGPGKYDDVCTHAREETKADGVVLMILNGEHGDGFSVQLPPLVLLNLPNILRMMADQIQEEISVIS